MSWGTGWTGDDDRQLRELWASGLATVLIGERMQRGKNSIIGRAHRLGLPGRGNPAAKRPSKPVAIAMPRCADLTGLQFGNRVVLGRADRVPGDSRVYWVARCSCGRCDDVQGYALRRSRMCAACSRAANAPVNPRARAAVPTVAAPAPVVAETNVVQLPTPERRIVTQSAAYAPKAKRPVSQAGPGPARTCQFPLTSARPWRFCGEASMPGKSWCGCHAARVFVQKRQASEVAA